MSYRVMIIAGEVSGDLHGANVVKELKKLAPKIEIFGIGGDKMKKAGMDLTYHIESMSFLGFLEVVRHLPFIWKVMQRLTKLLEEREPDLVILIDYPGFNLRFADRAKKRRIPVLYYISPQVWAWNQGRVHKIAKVVDKMAVIFLFEVGFYEEVDLDIEFVGHPLLEEIDFDSILDRGEICEELSLNPENRIIGILPGSRKQEVERILPTLLRTAEMLQRKIDEKLQILVGVAPNLSIDFVEKYTQKCSVPITCVKEYTYNIMKNSDLLMVTSGTATLESALFATPMLVVYKMTWLSYQIGKRVVKIDRIGLVNVVAEKIVAPEFIQYEANPKKISETAYELLMNLEKRQQMINELREVRKKLGEKGASQKVARIALEMLNIGNCTATNDTNIHSQERRNESLK